MEVLYPSLLPKVPRNPTVDEDDKVLPWEKISELVDHLSSVAIQHSKQCTMDPHFSSDSIICSIT